MQTGRGCPLPGPNILVFSSGGYGHIPIPLFMRDQPLRNSKPMEDRRYLVSYVGGLEQEVAGTGERGHVCNATPPIFLDLLDF